MTDSAKGQLVVDSTALAALSHRLRSSSTALSHVTAGAILSRAAASCAPSATCAAADRASTRWSQTLRLLLDSVLDAAAAVMTAAAAYDELEHGVATASRSAPALADHVPAPSEPALARMEQVGRDHRTGARA